MNLVALVNRATAEQRKYQLCSDGTRLNEAQRYILDAFLDSYYDNKSLYFNPYMGRATGKTIILLKLAEITGIPFYDPKGQALDMRLRGIKTVQAEKDLSFHSPVIVDSQYNADSLKRINPNRGIFGIEDNLRAAFFEYKPAFITPTKIRERGFLN